MAGVLQLMQGTAPATPGSFMEVIWSQSGGTDGNGLNLANRLFAKDSSGNIYQLLNQARFNYIRNSGFWWAQRQRVDTATTYSSTTGRAISADGWGITNENASATYAQIYAGSAPETGLSAVAYGQFLKTTSNGKLCVSQVIENQDAVLLHNRVVRLQCLMKGQGATPTIKFGLLELTSAGTADTPPATFISAFNGGGTNPTFGTNLSFLPSASTGDNVSITNNVASAVLSANWQRFGMTVTVSSNCRNLIPVFFSDQQITATQGFNITQVSLTDGYEVQDWCPGPFQAERLRVLRFYQKSFNNDNLAPATNVGVNSGELRGIAGKAGALAEFIPMRFEMKMRVTPSTITLYNPAAANNQVRDVTAAADCTASTVTGATSVDFYVAATGNAATAVGNLLAVHYTADAEI